MGTISYTIPTAGSTANSVADPEVATALQTLLTWANGNIDAVNLSAALAQAAAVNQSGQTVKGAVSISASQSTSSTTYTTLATPDQVTGIVLPTNGLIRVWYQAQASSSVSSAGRAALFIGSNQATVQASLGASTQSPLVQAAVIAGMVTNSLFTTPFGLQTIGATTFSGDVTTGQGIGGYAVQTSLTNSLITELNGTQYQWIQSGTNIFVAAGGAWDIFAAAGTYTVSVQFKASSGTVTASNRKLWVQALSFA
jgi:hypothetical protein